MYPDPEGTKFTDGVSAATEADYAYTATVWAGLNINAPDVISKVDMLNEIVVDLGAVTEGITNYKINVLNSNAVGISAPESIEIQVSSDKTNYESVGTATGEKIYEAAVEGDGIFLFTLNAPEEKSARYVKYVIKQSSSWCFVSELEIITGGETGDPVSAVSEDDESSASESKGDESSAAEDTSSEGTTSKEDTSKKSDSSDSTSEVESDGLDTWVIVVIAAGVIIIIAIVVIATKKKK